LPACREPPGTLLEVNMDRWIDIVQGIAVWVGVLVVMGTIGIATLS